MFILKKGHQPGVYVPLRALFLVLLCHSLSLPYNYYAINCGAFFCNPSCSMLKKTTAKQTQYDGKNNC